MLLLALGLLIGCEPGEDAAPVARPTEGVAPRSLWAERGEALLVRVDDAEDADLAAATAEAQATAEDARVRWSVAEPEDRARWAIKWKAETADGGVEYLWVQPVHWSAFRVEGVLVTEPVAELAEPASGRTGGDLVGFPVEALVDWVHYDTDDLRGPREGGFTINVLEGRFGRPAGDR